MSQEDVQAAVYELQVHQIELDLQNEELRQAQFDLAEARDRYIDLYEFAPVGYFTLDEGCTIRQANLTASSLLHADRSKLVGRRLQSLVTPASQDDVYRHFCAVTSSQAKQVCQLQVQRLDGTCFFGRLETVPARGDVSKMRFWCTLSDVTDLHDAVAELQALNETLEQRVTQTARRRPSSAPRSCGIWRPKSPRPSSGNAAKLPNSSTTTCNRCSSPRGCNWARSAAARKRKPRTRPLPRWMPCCSNRWTSRAP